MNRSRIEWADHTWNPITGCRDQCNSCRYKSIISGLSCGDYRMNLSERNQYREDGDIRILDHSFFVSEMGCDSKYPFGHLPTYHRYRLDRLGILKTGKNIVCGTVGEMFGYSVQANCYEEIFETCKSYPQHNYLFLSEVAYDGLEAKDIMPQQDNMWYGSVIYTAWEPIFSEEGYCHFLYINPMKDLASSLAKRVRPKWVVIGNGGCKYYKRDLPLKEWVDNILQFADLTGVPVYMEDCFSDMYPGGLRKEYPAQLRWENGRRLSGRLKNRVMARCGRCDQEKMKADMVTLQGRLKRHESSKQVGHICKMCFGVFCKEYGFRDILGGNSNG